MLPTLSFHLHSDSHDRSGASNQATLNTYKAVGIAEHWELSMALFNVSVKSPVRKWNPMLVSNTSSRSERKQQVLEWAYLSPEILGVIAADIVL